MNQNEALERLGREGCGLGIYRMLANFVLLVVAFRSFPEHAGFVAVGLVVLNRAFDAVLFTQQALTRAAEVRLDHGERTTRHAILLAHELASTGRMAGEPSWPLDDDDYWVDRGFWPTVHKRVKRELDRDDITDDLEPFKAAPWWKATALVGLNVTGRFIGDLVSIVIAYAIAGSV